MPSIPDPFPQGWKGSHLSPSGREAESEGVLKSALSVDKNRLNQQALSLSASEMALIAFSISFFETSKCVTALIVSEEVAIK